MTTTPTIPRHPLLQALQAADGVQAASFSGYASGAADDTRLRLYEDLSLERWLEIPIPAVLYWEAPDPAQPARVTVYVDRRRELAAMTRHVAPAGELAAARAPCAGCSAPNRPWRPPDTVKRAPTFDDCMRAAEEAFAATATRLLIDEAAALRSPRQDPLRLERIDEQKQTAKAALWFQLQQCVATRRPPLFVTVRDRLTCATVTVPFDLGLLYNDIVLRNLELPEDYVSCNGPI